MHALIAAVPLVVCGCADQGYQTFSVTYEYTDQNRWSRGQRALQDAQDRCYFGGSQYAMAVGPPQIVGTANGHYQATQSFYCVGMRGEG